MQRQFSKVLSSCCFTALLTVLSNTGWAAEIIKVRSIIENNQVVLGGTVIPSKEVNISAQIPGRIESIAGAEGDAFKEGDILVSIDTDDLTAKREAAVIGLHNAQISWQNANVQYQRELRSPKTDNINQMPGMGMPSIFDKMITRHAGEMMDFGDPDVDRNADYYQSRTRLEQSKNAIYQAQAQIKQIDAALRDAKAIAPFSGVIMKKMIERGDTVQPGQALLVFSDTTALQIKAEVPSRLVRYLQLGMRIRALLDSKQAVITTIEQIYPVADAKTHTVTVKFGLPTGIPANPGMYAEVMIPDRSTVQKTVLVIPRSAVIEGGSLPRVLVMDENNKSSKLHIVRLGGLIDKENVVVLSGLKNGDRIINNPPSDATSGWTP